MKLDILAFGAHPDDVELSCAGTLIKHVDSGYACGIVDLTRGELGTRGTPAQRDQEASNAGGIMGIKIRENLNMRDGFFTNDEVHQLQVIRMIRKYKPEIILCNAIEDRHPDHARAAELVATASFLSGLVKIETFIDDTAQEAWRPRKVLHYIQDKELKPDILIDITGYMDRKWDAIRAFRTQFHNPELGEPETYISKPEFLEALRGRHLMYGKYIGVTHAEGFTTSQYLGVRHFNELL